jgi:ABC-type uncharacterized transport system permease subunit
MPTILLHLLPAALYAALGLACWRKTEVRRGYLLILLLAALTSHAWVLGSLIFDQEGNLSLGFSGVLSLTLWLAMLIYCLESLLTPLNRLLKYAAPIAAIACLVPIFVIGHPQTFMISSWAFRIHIVVAMLAYSLATLGVFHAVLLAAAEHNLHSARLGNDSELPPLLVLDNLLFRLIHAAFAFLTLTVGSGLLFSEQIFGQPLTLNHKTIFGIASWLLFATLLVGRRYLGWRGKTATRLLLTGFVLLLLAYAGTRFVLEIVLGRSI